jgi:excisionase family DNA binding protein
MYYNNIAELAKTCPELTINVKLGELIEAVEHCVNSTRTNLEQIIQDEAQEKYLSIEKTAELLEVDKSTLWRWDKSNYLKPIALGGKRRYRMSDVKKILEG